MAGEGNLDDPGGPVGIAGGPGHLDGPQRPQQISKVGVGKETKLYASGYTRLLKAVREMAG